MRSSGRRSLRRELGDLRRAGELLCSLARSLREAGRTPEAEAVVGRLLGCWSRWGLLVSWRAPMGSLPTVHDRCRSRGDGRLGRESDRDRREPRRYRNAGARPRLASARRCSTPARETGRKSSSGACARPASRAGRHAGRAFNNLVGCGAPVARLRPGGALRRGRDRVLRGPRPRPVVATAAGKSSHSWNWIADAGTRPCDSATRCLRAPGCALGPRA